MADALCIRLSLIGPVRGNLLRKIGYSGAPGKKSGARSAPAVGRANHPLHPPRGFLPRPSEMPESDSLALTGISGSTAQQQASAVLCFQRFLAQAPESEYATGGKNWKLLPKALMCAPDVYTKVRLCLGAHRRTRPLTHPHPPPRPSSRRTWPRFRTPAARPR